MKQTDYRQNPWAGLSSYEDPAKSNKILKFCGRNSDTIDVTRLIDDNFFVTLYGKSGIGKTSLLNAGVFPALRHKYYTPLSLRLRMTDKALSFQNIITQAIERTVYESGGQLHIVNVVDEPTDNTAIDYLWRWFARRRFFTAEGYVTFPVIVFDQFEESLRQEEWRHKTEILLAQLNYIIDESHAICDCLVDGQNYTYDFNFRFVLSIREDDLYRLEDSLDNCSLPDLKHCRYRLRSLSEKGARDVIQIPGINCIDAVDLDKITDKILAEIKENGEINSLMLSLICSQLHNELEDGDKISLDKVENQGIKSSLKRFYLDTVDDFDIEQREKFEDLLVEDGHRKPISMKEFKKNIPDGNQFYDADSSKKILTKIEISSLNDEDHIFVELAHDKLAQVIEEIKNDRKLDKDSPKQTYKSGDQLVELVANDGRKDVFISYKRETVSYVARLSKELEAHGIYAWFDINELHQEVGKEYTKRIHRGIDNSKFFLLIYTKDVEHSNFIINEELAYAVKQNKTILFYPKDNIDISKSKLKQYVANIQWLDTVATSVHQRDTQESIGDEQRLFSLSSLINQKHEMSQFEDQSLFLIRIALQRLLGKITVFGNYRKLCGSGMNEFYDSEQFSLRVFNKALFIPIPNKYKNRLEELHFFRKSKTEEVTRHLARIEPDVDEILGLFYDFINRHKDVYNMSLIHERLTEYLDNEKYRSIVLPEPNTFDVTDFLNIVSQMVACSFVSDLERGRVMFNGTELGVYDIKDFRAMDSEEHHVDMQLYYSDYFTFKCMTETYHILCSIDEKPFEIKGIRDIKPLAPFFCSLGLGGFLAAYINGNVSLMWTKRSDNISSGDIWHFSYDETVNLLLDGTKDRMGHLLVGEDNDVTINVEELISRALKEEVGVTKTKMKEGKNGIFEVGIIQSERLEIELISQAVINLKDTPSPEEQISEMLADASDGYLEISKVKFLPLRDKRELVGKLITPESYAVYLRMQSRLENYVCGENLLIEEGSRIDEGAELGDNCRIHRNVYIGKDVKIGNNVKIQNNNSIYEGVTLEDGVFIGTNVSFINDRYPRSIMRDGRQVVPKDWSMEETRVCYGASIGAGSVIMCGVTIGKWAMVAAGSVVLEDVPEGAMVAGNPAKIIKTNIAY